MRKATALSVMLSRISSAMELAQPTNPGERSDAVPSGKGIRAHGSTPRPTAAHMFGSFGPYVLIVAVTCSYYVAIAPLLLGHTDLGWHLAAGDLIRSQGSVPAHEPWSFTAGDTRWYNLSWLWDVVASLLFRYGHFTALILATIFLGGLIAGGLAAICLKSHATPVAACIAVIFACILYPTFAVPDVFLAASPNIATLLFCVAFYGACLFRRHLWIAPLVMALWVNMHGGFVLGFFILGVFAAVAVVRRNASAFSAYFIATLACLAATLVNPLGWHVYEGVLSTLGHFVQHYITEWQPYLGAMTFPQCIPACAYILLFAVLELTGRNAAPAEARLLSWCFLLLGLWQLRYLSIFFLFSTLPVALNLSHLRLSVLRHAISEAMLGVVGLSVLGLLPLLYWHAVPAQPRLPPIYPEAELAYLEQHFPHAHLLNHWNYGGFLIFRNRGAIPLFVDGRAATAYPDTLLRDYFDLITWEVDAAAWKRVLGRYDIDTVMWPKAHTQLASFLVGTQKWTQVYSGDVANIYVREQ